MPDSFAHLRDPSETNIDRLATRLAWLVLLVAVAFGLVWRARQFGGQFSFSVDELAIARNITDRTIGGLFQRLEFGQIAPIGFLLALKTSASLFGASEWSLRLLPFVSGLVTIPLFWVVARRTLLDQVDAALKDSGADPRHLQIELTEHALVEDIAANVQVLATLKLRGMKIAIDDFGTGLSSLAYLKRLPIDKIKIDRSFVSDLRGAGEDYAIVATIAGLAQALNKEIVAEGIETRQQLAVLKRLGVQHGQGFLFSRAVPAGEVELLAATAAMTST